MALDEVLPGDQNALAVVRRGHCSGEILMDSLFREKGVTVNRRKCLCAASEIVVEVHAHGTVEYKKVEGPRLEIQRGDSVAPAWRGPLSMSTGRSYLF